MKIAIFFLIAIFSKDLYAHDLSPWERRIAIPPSVKKLVDIQDKESSEYEGYAFEATLDLIHLSKTHLQSGNYAKSLHFISLAKSLFPYRGDVQALFNKVIYFFIRETNDLVAENIISCNELRYRAKIISRLSIKKAREIKTKNISCTIEIGDKKKSISNIDLNAWIEESYVINNTNFTSVKEVDFYNQAKVKEIEEREYEKVYTLGFPAQELLYSSLKILNGLQIIPRLELATNENENGNGKVKLSGDYSVTSSSLYSLEGHCRFLSPFFSLPPKAVGTTYFYGKANCGVPSDTSIKPGFYNGDWDFEGIKLPLMRQATSFTSSTKGASTPLIDLFPRLIDMKLILEYKDATQRSYSFLIDVNSPHKFMSWINLPSMNRYFPKTKAKNGLIKFKPQNKIEVVLGSKEILRSLDDIKIVFDSEKFFRRMSKALKISRK